MNKDTLERMKQAQNEESLRIEKLECFERVSADFDLE